MPIDSPIITVALLMAIHPFDSGQNPAFGHSAAPNATVEQSSAQPAKLCSPSASVVAINVVDLAGKPVPGTTVAMTRLRDKKSLGNAKEMRPGLGEFVLLQTDALQWLTPKGDRIRLLVTAGALVTTAVITAGRDSTGCKIVQRSGPSVITLK